MKLPSGECYKPHWWLGTIGSGNGLVLSGSKPLPKLCFYQGWGQVLLEVLESSTSTFKICKFKYKYKYSQYLDGIKYIKYFFIQVQVQVPSTLVTKNSTVSLWVQNSFTTITLVHTVTYKVKNTFQICTKITFILWNQPWIDKLCICHPTQLMDHMINHGRSWLIVIASTKILQTKFSNTFLKWEFMCSLSNSAEVYSWWSV